MSDVPEGYSKSEVGVIPKDWEMKTLREVVDFLDGKRRPIKDSDRAKMRGQYPYYGASGIIDYVNDYIFDDNLILLGEDGENIISRNSRLVFQISGKVWVNNHAHVLKPKYGTDIIFLTEYLESLNYELFNTGTAQPKLNQNVCSSIPVLSPPLPEQQAIASALSDVDALITALEQLITKKRNIKQGAIQQLLTGEKRLPGFGGAWEANSIESLTPLNKKYGIVDGPFGSNLKIIHYRKSGIPIITSGYVTEGIFIATDYLYVDIEKFKQEKRSAVHGGDIVMAKIGARCGASAILPKNHEKGLLSGNALKITVDETKHSTYFIWQILWSIYTTGEIETLKSVGAQPAVSMPNLKKFQINLPPLPEQQAIAQILSDMDTEIESLEQKRNKYKVIKQGMMQELLTGKTRLV